MIWLQHAYNKVIILSWHSVHRGSNGHTLINRSRVGCIEEERWLASHNINNNCGIGQSWL